MYTSVTSKYHRSRHLRRTVITYLIVSVLCVVIDKIYALFGHGVYSASMSLMFLYPLLGGVLPFFTVWLLLRQTEGMPYYRLIYNCYNSGLATLTIGSLLNGVFEIAGTSSPYMIVFYVCGWTMLAAGALGFLASLFTPRRQKP